MARACGRGLKWFFFQEALLSSIDLTRDGVIATVAINNPAKLNALTVAMWRELARVRSGLRPVLAVTLSLAPELGITIAPFHRRPVAPVQPVPLVTIFRAIGPADFACPSSEHLAQLAA